MFKFFLKKPNKLNASKAKFKGKLGQKLKTVILTYIVAHKEIIGIGSISSYPKELDEIVELAVDITTNCHRTLHRLYVPLLDENRPRLIAERFHLRLLQRLALHQMLDLTVQIRVRRHRFLSFSVTHSLPLSLRSDLQPPRSPISPIEIKSNPESSTDLRDSKIFFNRNEDSSSKPSICEVIGLGLGFRMKRIVLEIGWVSTFRAFLALLFLSLSFSLRVSLSIFWWKRKKNEKKKIKEIKSKSYLCEWEKEEGNRCSHKRKKWNENETFLKCEMKCGIAMFLWNEIHTVCVLLEELIN